VFLWAPLIAGAAAASGSASAIRQLLIGVWPAPIYGKPDGKMLQQAGTGARGMSDIPAIEHMIG
jgi:hypothetical protein